eukprot:5503772-Prymnesium_polylepis.1
MRSPSSLHSTISGLSPRCDRPPPPAAASDSAISPPAPAVPYQSRLGCPPAVRARRQLPVRHPPLPPARSPSGRVLPPRARPASGTSPQSRPRCTAGLPAQLLERRLLQHRVREAAPPFRRHARHHGRLERRQRAPHQWSGRARERIADLAAVVQRASHAHDAALEELHLGHGTAAAVRRGRVR